MNYYTESVEADAHHKLNELVSSSGTPESVLDSTLSALRQLAAFNRTKIKKGTVHSDIGSHSGLMHNNVLQQHSNFKGV